MTSLPVTTDRAARVGAVLEAIVDVSRGLAGPRSTPFGDAVLTRTQLEILFVLAHSDGPVTPGHLATAVRVTRGGWTVTAVAADLGCALAGRTVRGCGRAADGTVVRCPGRRRPHGAVRAAAPRGGALMGAVFVTGATGTVGAAVTEQLLARGHSVIAGIRHDRDADRVPSAAATRDFSFDDAPAQHDAVLAGVDRLFLMRPPAISDVQGKLFPVIDAALRRGVRQIAFLSLQGVQVNRGTPHHAVEKYLRITGSPYTFLRPNFFMQNLSTTYAAPIREDGEIFVPAGRSFTAFIDARDVGAAAAATLSTPGHVGRAYTLSGEQSLGYHRVAEIMSEVLGRRIRYERPGEDAYLSRLVADGAPLDYIAVQKMIHRVVRLNVSAFPNRSIRGLTGRPATTMRQFVSDYAETWTS